LADTEISTSAGRKRKKLLFTGGGGAGTEALNRLLSKYYDVHFADANIEAKPYSIVAGSWHTIPYATADNFIDELRLLCRTLAIDLLIPGVDEELLVISQFRNSIGCEVLLPPTEFIQTHLDKYSSNLFLKRHGLPLPKTELIIAQHQVSFPCIAKPRSGRGSRGVAVIRSETELRAHVLLSRAAADEFILQELLAGQEYTVMVLADKRGRLRAVVPVKVGLKRGVTIRAETDHDEAVIAACVAIHAANPVPGVYNVQLMKSVDGVAKPFEINPRISTTTCLALAAGIDLISIFQEDEELAGDETKQLACFESGVKLRRSWFNEITS
jgi:carbamoyl-phosphate synthase large subunit